jgi:ligand-binding sensor domain-containing protein
MMKEKWLLLLMGLLLTASGHLFALDPHKEVTQYIHKTWSTDDGLPNNHITALLQTSDEYLWIGTGDGPARFDGVKFDVFNSDNTAVIPDNRVTVFLETSSLRATM